MADVEKMRINLAKNEEKLAKKVALLAKYENKKAKLSAQWEKLTGEKYEESVAKMNANTDELSIWGKFKKYYSEDVANLYYDISTFYDYGRWTSNPIVCTQDGIKELEERCQKYRDSIAQEEKKVADRQASIASHSVSINGKDVNVIIEFLNNWEKEVVKHLMKIFDRYVTEADAWYEENIKNSAEYKLYYGYGYSMEDLEAVWKNSEYVKYYPTYLDYCHAGYKNDCRKAIENALDELREKYDTLFSPKVIERYAKTLHNPDRKVFEENMRKAVGKEKDRKYDQLIDDVEHIVGKIIDMSHIKIGHKGDLEGYVIGTDGEAELWTSSAGGFNENVIVNVKHGQCFHFRFYVKRRA